MEDLLIKILSEAFGYPVRLQGSLAPDEAYPDDFFTYWNDSSDGDSFYSNEEGAIDWHYSLNFYSIDPQRVSDKLKEAKKVLKSAGFTVTGGGYSVASDVLTHTGRGISVRYREEI